ncbi:hypothetical protein CO670_15280 [Rhizobium sp. J15]|uniref:hypothetical protein n=1 Tax=Rhizobium sp. J15 TaxID=2035450 RepID=UPI000BEAB9B6|nr:hypothetical protein [Rhizobium sp. J15]PDT15857.1 hypothetical protein CO670_15280 [Rhizobium sp. J15]
MTPFMKEPCAHCPYRRDVRPFLRIERGYELAFLAQNKYNEFFCHKTLDHDDEEGETCIGEKSLICAGFLTLQINESGARVPNGFEPSILAYDNTHEMQEAYEDETDGCWVSPKWLEREKSR